MKLLQFTKKTMMLCLCALFLLSLQFTLIFTFASKKAYAAASDLISNPDFENSTSTSTGKPNNPSYWSAAGGDEDNVSKGVIDTENATFTKNTKYGLDENPSTHSGADDTKILMIDSQDSYTRFGYKTSETIDLEKNSYYKLSVYCKTETLTNGASIYLTGSEKALTNQYHFVDITTNPTINSGWTNYTFYIRTNINEKANLTLELWLGSKADNNVTSNGAVFFDDITISTIDQNLYHEYINSYDFSDEDNMPETYRNIDLTKNLYPNQFENSNFESDTLVGWERVISGGEEGTYSGLTIAGNTSEMLADMHLENTEVIPGSTNTYGNTKALYINHTNEDGSHTEYKSTPITIKQHSFAMISVYAKTGNIKNGGAYVSAQAVEEAINPGEKEEDDAELKVTSSAFSSSTTALEVYNNYCVVTIYVEGNPYRDTNITLSLGLGSEDTKTKGYVLFDDIQVNYISYTSYKGASENVLKLYKDSDTTKISNGSFNFSNSEKPATYPVAPRNWTVSNDISGIININEANFNAKQSTTVPTYGANAVNPGPINYPGADTNITTTKQNVLMLRSDNVNSFVSATSDTFAYDISTTSENDSSTTPIVAISVYAKVQDNLSNSESGANITLLNGAYTIAAINNIRSTEWTKYTIYLEANLSTLSLQLVLSLGSEANPTSGYAYFDFVSYTTNITKEEVATRDKNTTVYTTLSNNNFDSYIAKENGVHTPTTMTSTDVSSATTAGVIDASTISTHVVNVDIPAREGKVNNNLLMIKNNAPTNYSYTTNYSYNFASGSHYVVTVWVYTSNLTTNEDIEEYGVNISMTNVEKSFSHVSSKIELDENVWTAFKFYISAQTDSSITSTLTVSLGDEDHPTQGFVFVDAISVESIDAETYNEATENDYTIKTIAEVAIPEETPEEETTPAQTGAGVNYWILFSSIILAVALVIALIGFAVRKLNFRIPRFSKNKKADYNRDLGLNHADVKRELAAARAAKLKELDKQIANTKDSMAKLKADYEASIKGLDNEQKVEKLFTKYAKANGKLQTEVDNYESAKKYLTDETNIKLEEQREIRKRQIMLEEENRLLKQNQAAIEKEKQKEKEAKKAKEEEGKKKARLKSKQ